MKKLFILTVMMMAVYSVNAQLKVDTTGCVAIGQNVSGIANLCVKGNKNYAINSTTYLTNTNMSTIAGIRCNVTSKQSDTFYGIETNATGNNVDEFCKVVGIKALSRGNANTQGLPIGMWGCLSSFTPSPVGVGVLGSIQSAITNGIIDKQYAGFFVGLTKVRGDLIVTGNIQGTILGASAPSSGVTEGDVSDRRSSHLFSDALTGLTANRYYHKLSDETARALNADNSTRELALSIDYENLSEEECLAMEEAEFNTQDKEEIPELSSIEKQVLTKQHYGLDADQLEDVFPDLVYENENGTKSINYVEMVPILVQAINEMNAKIEVLEGGAAAKKAATRATGIDDTGDDVTMLSLGQNKPNPFGTSTDIEVTVPDDVQKAFIYIYDLQGKKIDQVDITDRGKQTIQLNAASLGNGMYLYSLIADGKVIVTRRMIVEK